MTPGQAPPLKLNEQILQILSVIGHTPEEAQKHVRTLNGTITDLTVIYLLAGVTDEKRQEISDTLKDEKDPERFLEKLGAFFTEEVMLDATTTAALDVFRTYFRELQPALTAEQQSKINTIMQTTIRSLKQP